MDTSTKLAELMNFGYDYYSSHPTLDMTVQTSEPLTTDYDRSSHMALSHSMPNGAMLCCENSYQGAAVGIR